MLLACLWFWPCCANEAAAAFVDKLTKLLLFKLFAGVALLAVFGGTAEYVDDDADATETPGVASEDEGAMLTVVATPTAVVTAVA